ncbi:hypothetical protein Tco_1366922, partial [Tanacetum coccineum]
DGGDGEDVVVVVRRWWVGRGGEVVRCGGDGDGNGCGGVRGMEMMEVRRLWPEVGRKKGDGAEILKEGGV